MTLDYAERRGIASRLGIESDINLDAGSAQPRAKPAKALDHRITGLEPDPRVPAADLDTSRVSARTKKAPEHRITGLEPEPRIQPPSALEGALDRYAQAYQSLAARKRDRLPVHVQERALHKAGMQLDRAGGAGTAALLGLALRYDPETARAMTERSGADRVSHLLKGMAREEAAMDDPNGRADRFIKDWQVLETSRRQLRGRGHDTLRAEIDAMETRLIGRLRGDAALTAALEHRRDELGIGPLRAGESIVQAMQKGITRAHDQDHTHSRNRDYDGGVEL